MATKQATREVVIDKANESNLGTKTATTQAGQASRTFKSKSLAELLERAARVQRLIACMGSTDIYDLEATYNIETDEWTGRLFKKW